LTRYLILGSAGQIGSGLTKYLVSQGHAVEGFDIANSGAEDLREYPNQLLCEKLKEVDFVFFLAFDVGGSKYLSEYQNSLSFIENNLRIMTNVFDALSSHSLPFLFASSQMVGIEDSTYGLLKKLGEKYATVAGGISARFWNVYGKESHGIKSHVITDFIQMAISNKKISMRTEGTEVRDFLFIDDCSSALEWASKQFAMIKNAYSVIDIASFSYTSILDIARIVAEKTGSTVEVGTGIDLVQSGHRFDPREDILKYWKPAVNIKEGISKLVEEAIR
jgi:nucleoside-diphosphate-sugar epimerase